jgi:hypothetical protein
MRGLMSRSPFDPFNQGEQGNYSVYSNHWDSTDGGASYSFIGSSFAVVPVGVSFTCFLFNRVILIDDNDGVPKQTALYNIISPCNASCKANTATFTFTYPQRPSQALLSAEPYVGVSPHVVCSHVAALQPATACGGCADIDLPPVAFFAGGGGGGDYLGGGGGTGPVQWDGHHGSGRWR